MPNRYEPKQLHSALGTTGTGEQYWICETNKPNIYTLISKETMEQFPELRHCNKRIIYNKIGVPYVYIKDMPLSRYILGLTPNQKLQADHIDRNTLDNRLCNLRVVSISENNKNRRNAAEKQSQHEGVLWIKKDKRWRASISKNGKKTILGQFKTELEAKDKITQYKESHSLQDMQTVIYAV